MCSDQHVKYRLPHEFPLTSFLLLITILKPMHMYVIDDHKIDVSFTRWLNQFYHLIVKCVLVCLEGWNLELFDFNSCR